MEGETSWFDYQSEYSIKDAGEFASYSTLTEEICNEPEVSMDLILPDDLIERILACLPIASIFRARSVCKRWREIVSSNRFLWSLSNVLVQRPWYFMFTSSDDPGGYAYDPILRKWYSFDLPCIQDPNCFFASSCGLVCFMDSNTRSQLFVCNPITKICKRLDDPPGPKCSDYSALAMSVDRKSREYNVVVAKSKQVPDDYLRWDLSISIYNSRTKSWETSKSEVLTGWRGGDESVMCNGTFYFLIYSSSVVGGSESRHSLVMYDVSRSSHISLMRNCVPVPCALTCGRLMNLNDELVMVGGIGKPDRSDIIKGIGIWKLCKREWQEVSRMPHKFFQGFGEFDDVFASSGTDDLIYIQSYGAPALLVFDMNQKLWKWSQKCPVSKRFPLQLFTGFSFEPRLEMDVSLVDGCLMPKAARTRSEFDSYTGSIHVYQGFRRLHMKMKAYLLSRWSCWCLTSYHIRRKSKALPLLSSYVEFLSNDQENSTPVWAYYCIK